METTNLFNFSQDAPGRPSTWVAGELRGTYYHDAPTRNPRSVPNATSAELELHL